MTKVARVVPTPCWVNRECALTFCYEDTDLFPRDPRSISEDVVATTENPNRSDPLNQTGVLPPTSCRLWSGDLAPNQRQVMEQSIRATPLD